MIAPKVVDKKHVTLNHIIYICVCVCVCVCLWGLGGGGEQSYRSLYGLFGWSGGRTESRVELVKNKLILC